MSMETVEKEFFRTKFKKQNAELVISTEGFIPSNMEEQHEKEMTEWLKKLKDFETDEELVSILTESDRRYTWKYIDDFDKELNPFLLATAKMIGKKVVYINKRKGIHLSLDHNWNFQGTMDKPETGELILAYHEFSARDLNKEQKENYISFGKLAEFLTSGKAYLKYDEELNFWIQKKRQRENFFVDSNYYDIFSYSNPYFILNIKKDEVSSINFYGCSSNENLYGIENFLMNEVFDDFSYEQITEIISSLTKLSLYFEKYKTKSKKIITSLKQIKESIEKTLKKRYENKISELKKSIFLTIFGSKPIIEAKTLEKNCEKIEDAINNNKENKYETFSDKAVNKQGGNIKTEKAVPFGYNEETKKLLEKYIGNKNGEGWIFERKIFRLDKEKAEQLKNYCLTGKEKGQKEKDFFLNISDKIFAFSELEYGQLKEKLTDYFEKISEEFHEIKLQQITDYDNILSAFKVIEEKASELSVNEKEEIVSLIETLESKIKDNDENVSNSCYAFKAVAKQVLAMSSEEIEEEKDELLKFLEELIVKIEGFSWK